MCDVFSLILPENKFLSFSLEITNVCILYLSEVIVGDSILLQKYQRKIAERDTMMQDLASEYLNHPLTSTKVYLEMDKG